LRCVTRRQHSTARSRPAPTCACGHTAQPIPPSGQPCVDHTGPPRRQVPFRSGEHRTSDRQTRRPLSFAARAPISTDNLWRTYGRIQSCYPGNFGNVPGHNSAAGNRFRCPQWTHQVPRFAVVTPPLDVTPGRTHVQPRGTRGRHRVCTRAPPVRTYLIHPGFATRKLVKIKSGSIPEKKLNKTQIRTKIGGRFVYTWP
jgi:hypothetical protein